jgi:hypothetical protein
MTFIVKSIIKYLPLLTTEELDTITFMFNKPIIL